VACWSNTCFSGFALYLKLNNFYPSQLSPASSSKFQVDTRWCMHIHAVETWTEMQKLNFLDTYWYCMDTHMIHTYTYIYMHIRSRYAPIYVVCMFAVLKMYVHVCTSVCVLYVYVCAYVHVFFAAKSAIRIDTYKYAHICTYIQDKTEICTDMHEICTTYAHICTDTYTFH
jgi:hypothetical protein